MAFIDPVSPYCGWPSKQQAAVTIGISTKTLEKLALKKEIQTARYKRPETGATVNVYHPADVERLRAARNPAGAPFVVHPFDGAGPEVTTADPGPETGLERASSPSAALAVSEMFLERLAAVLRPVDPPAAPVAAAVDPLAVPVTQKLYLTLKEAAAYVGVSTGRLRALVNGGRFDPQGYFMAGRSYRFRRVFLETLGPDDLETQAEIDKGLTSVFGRQSSRTSETSETS